MPIDGRSSLGEQLNVSAPAEMDLSQLTPEAGALIAMRMEGGASREEAIISLLNDATKRMQTGVVSLDTTMIYQHHPEVRLAVEKATGQTTSDGKRITVARALTILMVRGAKAPKKQGPPGNRTGSADFSDLTGSLEDLLGSFFKKQ